MRLTLALIRAWWTTPVDYSGVVNYLRSRGIGFHARIVVALCAAALAVVPAVMHASPSGPSGSVGAWIAYACAAVAVGFALRWLIGPWPSFHESLLFVALSDVVITLASFQDSNTLVGMFGLNALALLSAYVVVFHDAKVLFAHIAWAMLSVGIFAVTLATGPSGDVSLAAAKSLVTAFAIAGAPPFIQFAYWLLRTDADESLIDPLTRVLNRRGLHTHAAFITADPPGDDVVVMAIDIDLFKKVNDTFGHAVGDEVLVRTARRIESVARGHAIVARIGGEEFVLVDIMPRGVAEVVAHRVRRSIAAPADRARVTASIGVAAMPVEEFVAPDTHRGRRLDALVAVADVAMYAAKDAGRDAVCADFSPVVVPPDPDWRPPDALVGRQLGRPAGPERPSTMRRRRSRRRR